MSTNNIDLPNPERMSRTIPFHVPTYAGGEVAVLSQAVTSGKWAEISEESRHFFKKYYPDAHCFFTNSCSSALELAVRALGISSGDEVIIPGYGYVAVANAVVNNGATPVFADVHLADGNIDIKSVEACITPHTKAVIGIHYAGNPFDIDALMQLCYKHNIYMIEDAAQCIGSSLNGKKLGSQGHIATLSFDYMKNISCGQGGLLIVNNLLVLPGVQTAYDNGTNRQELLDNVAGHFNWVGKDNNYQINPIASHFLAGQLKAVNEITNERLSKWNLYYNLLLPLQQLGKIILPNPGKSHNGHIFFIVTTSESERGALRSYLRKQGILSEQHYSSLANSMYGRQFFNAKNTLQNSEILCSQLLRLPLWNRISEDDIRAVVDSVQRFYSDDSLLKEHE